MFMALESLAAQLLGQMRVVPQSRQ